MKILIRVSEILLGIIFLGAGLNGYVVLFGYEEIIPTSPAAMEFFNEPYLLAMEKGVEIIAGFMLLIRRFVPLAIILLASLVVTLLEGVLVWGYWEHFRGLFASKPTIR